MVSKIVAKINLHCLEGIISYRRDKQNLNFEKWSGFISFLAVYKEPETAPNETVPVLIE